MFYLRPLSRYRYSADCRVSSTPEVLCICSVCLLTAWRQQTISYRPGWIFITRQGSDVKRHNADTYISFELQYSLHPNKSVGENNKLNLDFRNQDRKVLYTCAYPLCPVEFIKLNIFKRIVVIFIIYHFNTMKHPLYPQDFTNKSVFTCTSSFGAICFIFFHSKKFKF